MKISATCRSTTFPTARFHAVEVSKVTRLKQQRVILALCHYRYCDAAARQHLRPKPSKPPGCAPNRCISSANSAII